MQDYHRSGKGGAKYKGKRGAGILFTDGKQILLLKRSEDSDNPGTWGIPGGGARDGESSIANAVRETKEECGLESIPGSRSESLEQQDGRFQWTTFLYTVPEPFDVTMSHEHQASKWADLNSLSELHLHPKFKDELPRLLRAIRRKFSNSFVEWCRFQEIIEGGVENPES